MKKIFSVLLFCFVFTACSSLPTPPSSGGFQLRSFAEETLPNGLKLIWIQDGSLPRISFNMMVKAGVLNEPKGKEGVNSMTAALLDQGTAKRDALKLADDLDQIGSDFTQTAGSDFTTLSSTGLASLKSKMLDLYSEIILTPAFRTPEVDRRKSMVIAAIQKNQDQPSNYADQLADREIMGHHPYGRPVVGTIKSVRAMTRADLVRQYFAYYRPNNAILAVVGKYDDIFKNEVKSAFAKWGRGTIKSAPHENGDLRVRRTVIVSKKGLQQTQIRFGHLGITRSNPDFMALRMANVILGGAFASRLNQRIRDDLGLTYSISSNNDARLEPGSFEISTFTRHEKTADTILETRTLLKDFVDRGVTESEMDAAKALLIGQFPAALETPDRLAFNLMVLRIYGISDDYLRNFQSDVQKITRQQVNEAIRRNIHPNQLQVVVYSDEQALGEQIGRLDNVERVPMKVE